MKINNRLKKVSEYILDDSNIIDVGCDHALLSIYLIQNKKNISVIASDINEGPLKKAKENIKKFDLSNKIKVKQGYGIDTIEDNIDTIVISGLGGLTILDILFNGKDKLNNIKKIVLSPNNEFYKIRKEVIKLGYIIEKEEYFNDKNITYLIISFIKGQHKYSKKELIYGTNNNNSDYYKKLLDVEYFKLSKVPKKYIFKRINIKIKIKQLKKLI